ncbi:GNAT family N-acetyltransferase [Paenibacillus sp. DMB20]|uniref:GNAT family N-acetyltransferase n=1 Tax=Paenibacillus sp. DMB20 TaxID=1642570 RepID=UPI000627C40E|nr:N-acetyltransferase [Paenibacillus sp. DMB20]KKO52712.1 GNAT family acetyltransferase [Paenibacillus sp. DMB20]
MIHIKNIQPEHVGMFWELRLEALKTHPEAFGSSYEDSAGTPLDNVVKRIKNEKDNYILGAYTEDGQLRGMVGFVRESGMKLKHKGTIWGVYVSPAYRGQGIAQTLLEEVLNRGKEIEGLKQIHLSVVTANKTASELYKKLGFETYGIEKNALVYKGQGYDEELMAYYY